jgi:hypothetical protein
MIVTGIAWYMREQWEDFRRVSADKVEDTWEEWVENAERRIAQLKKEGVSVQKIVVDLPELQFWCRTKNRACDSSARAEYVTFKLHSP